VRLLLVTATDLEIQPLISSLRFVSDGGLRLRRYASGAHDVHVLTTGVGMVATAAWCTRALSADPYDLALNLGVCGSFKPSLAPGAVVQVMTDRLAELGAEDRGEFLTIQDLGLLGDDDWPFRGGRLVNGAPPATRAVTELPPADGITVSTVHGSAPTIARVVERFDPDVESMEGAAFMYACLIHGVRFAQVRAVSNAVEPRNRDAWKMADAIQNLGGVARRILEQA
jgi:futalosine hydrolase